MRLNRFFYFIALLLALPACGFGQRVPVAPNMLLNVGGLDAIVYSSVIKLDAQGNMYVTGYFIDRNDKADFDPSSRVTTLGIINASSGYVAKYSAAGALIWVKSFKGESNGLDVDHNGNVTVIGLRYPERYTPGTFYLDAFVLHLDNNGNKLWEKLILTGTKVIVPDPTRLFQDLQIGYKVASDDSGNLIAVFRFMGSPNVDGIIAAKGNCDGLVVKLDPNGNVIWKFNLGSAGSFNNSVQEALVDKDNNIIVAGYTDGTVDYNPLGTPVNVTADNSIFLAKYSPDGILQWVKSIKGNTPRYNVRLALDGQDNIYVNGSLTAELDFGVAPALTPNGYQDLFFAKYSSGGNLLYHKSIGGSGTSMRNSGLVTGPDNSVYLTGNFNGVVDADPSSAVAELNSGGTVGMFLAKYDDNGNYQWAFRVLRVSSYLEVANLSATEFDNTKLGVQDININSRDEILVTGTFQGTVNFNGTGCGVNSLTGPEDMFVVRYSPTSEIPITNNRLTVPVATNICEGIDPDPIIGSVPVGDHFTYQWQQSLDNRTFIDMTGETLKDFDPPVLSATTYYRRRLVTSECAAPNISNLVTLTLLKSAAPNTITAPFDILFCNSGNADQIRGSVPQAVGQVDYQWQQSPDGVNFTDIEGATAIDYDPPSLVATTHYRRLITNIPCNMGTPSNTIIITVVAVPVPTISPEQTICIGDAVTLIATGGIRYSWSPATGISDIESGQPRATPTVTTNYTVTMFNGYCTDVLRVKVNVVQKPQVNAGDDKNIINGDKVQLNAQVRDVEGATYQWTPATYLDNPAIANPIASPPKNITYRLTVKSANGCFTVSDEVAVNVRERLFMPNAFTPNGDGINDILIIPGLNTYAQSTLTIFNRNGQPVFKSVGNTKPWDGTHNGKPLPTGTYYYVIELNNDEHRRLSGYLSLIK